MSEENELALPEEFVVHAPGFPVPVPVDLIADVTNGNISEGAFVTLVALVHFQIEDDGVQFGEVFSNSHADLAARRGVSERTLRAHLVQLRQQGWVDYDGKSLTLYGQRKEVV